MIEAFIISDDMEGEVGCGRKISQGKNYQKENHYIGL